MSNIDATFLQRFCSRDRQRLNLNSPWSLDAFTYASNGKILLRVPLLRDIPWREDAPPVQRFFEGEPPVYLLPRRDCLVHQAPLLTTPHGYIAPDMLALLALLDDVHFAVYPDTPPVKATIPFTFAEGDGVVAPYYYPISTRWQMQPTSPGTPCHTLKTTILAQLESTTQ